MKALMQQSSRSEEQEIEHNCEIQEMNICKDENPSNQITNIRNITVIYHPTIKK
jgi:hypothetical protein